MTTLLLRIYFILSVITVPLFSAYSQQKDFTKYVNPFIGTGEHGHTYPGSTIPFGFVQLSPDTRTTSWDGCSGYHYSDTTIMGFSHTHLSGTGAADLGDILVMPYTGNIEIEPGKKSNEGYHSGFLHSNESALPGYYSVLLNKHNIKAELTSTMHVGYHKYTFPTSSKEARIIVDITHGIHNNHSFVSQVKIENDSTISGYRYSTGWAELKRLYFVIRFSKKFKASGISLYNKMPRPFPIALTKEQLKVVLTFDVDENESILIKTALSANSLENAYDNLNEIKGWNFSSVTENSKKEWNKMLSLIEVEGTEKQMEIFYTSLYHNFVVPTQISDKDSTFFGPDLAYHKSKSGNYYSTFSLWDTFRASHPLYTLLIPDKVSDFINNFIQHYEINGLLPIWPLWGTETYTMIGNHAIPVIAEASKKGINGFDKEKAYKAMKESSLKVHNNCYFDTLQKYGYLPYDRSTQSVSKTLEIAYDDWCVAQMAKELGKQDDYNFFITRSTFYKNIYDASTGFMRGKNSKGEWEPDFNPALTSYSGSYTEGNAWQYSWFVPHDVEGLIALHGGKEKFSQKLDSLFTTSSKLEGEVIDVTGLIGQYAHGNEPSHHIAYLFNHADHPEKTQYYVRKILEMMYDNSPGGLIGNEDCGQMSAWYIFSAMGIYPSNPASGNYEFGSPLFKESILHLPNGKRFTILAPKASEQNKYVKGIKLNGRKYSKHYITHKEVLNGGVLEFEMVSKLK